MRILYRMCARVYTKYSFENVIILYWSRCIYTLYIYVVSDYMTRVWVIYHHKHIYVDAAYNSANKKGMIQIILNSSEKFHFENCIFFIGEYILLLLTNVLTLNAPIGREYLNIYMINKLMLKICVLKLFFKILLYIYSNSLIL